MTNKAETFLVKQKCAGGRPVELLLETVLASGTKEDIAKALITAVRCVGECDRELLINHNAIHRLNCDVLNGMRLGRQLAEQVREDYKNKSQPGLVFLLWGKSEHCRKFAQEYGLAPHQWRHLDTDHWFRERLNGIEGPLRDKKSPFRLIVLDNFEWQPTHEQAGFMRARGFEC